MCRRSVLSSIKACSALLDPLLLSFTQVFSCFHGSRGHWPENSGHLLHGELGCRRAAVFSRDSVWARLPSLCSTRASAWLRLFKSLMQQEEAEPGLDTNIGPRVQTLLPRCCLPKVVFEAEFWKLVGLFKAQIKLGAHCTGKKKH